MDRVEELNNRLTSRNLPTDMLEPVFDPRPANTKGGLMPVITPHKAPTQDFFTYKTYHPETSFAPVTRSAPFKGFCERVNEESELRGQVFALQRSEKSVYVPSSESDMYVVDVPFKPVMNEDIKHMHKALFNEQSFNSFNPDPTPPGSNQLFNNDTKQNIKNIR
jgi:hypothetical protein